MPTPEDEWIILYRGDTRSPEEVFKHGFTARNPDSQITFGRKALDGSIIEDINPDDAVCLTTRVDIAPIFPLESDKPKTYIYAVRVKKKDVFMTYEAQLAAKSPLSFAQEVAVKQIQSQDVLYAVQADRHFNLSDEGYTDWMYGGFYQLDTEQFKKNSQMAKEHRKVIPDCVKVIQSREGMSIKFPITSYGKKELWTTQEQQNPEQTINPANYKEYKKLTAAALIIMQSHYCYFDPTKAMKDLANLGLIKEDFQKELPYSRSADGTYIFITLDELLAERKKTYHYSVQVVQFITQLSALYSTQKSIAAMTETTPIEDTQLLCLKPMITAFSLETECGTLLEKILEYSFETDERVQTYIDKTKRMIADGMCLKDLQNLQHQLKKIQCSTKIVHDIVTSFETSKGIFSFGMPEKAMRIKKAMNDVPVEDRGDLIEGKTDKTKDVNKALASHRHFFRLGTKEGVYLDKDNRIIESKAAKSFIRFKNKFVTETKEPKDKDKDEVDQQKGPR